MIRFNKSIHESEKWMPCPQEYVEYPGLAYIYRLDSLVVAKKLDKLHDVIGRRVGDVGFTVYNSVGEKVFLAIQSKKDQLYHVKLFNIYGNQVIDIQRTKGILFNRTLVWAPPDNYAGSIEHRPFEHISVKNREGTVVIIIRAVDPSNSSYNVVKKQEVTLMGKWDKVPGENIGVTFPEGLAVEMKAVLLGACLLLGDWRCGCASAAHTRTLD